MQASNIPPKFPEVFGNAAATANIRSIPQTSSDPNAASLHLGFPPNVFTDIAAGGEPMDGRDLNGIFNALSAWAQWQQAGGSVLFDSTFATATGGYPKGARVVSTTNPALVWVSTADNNTTNPDASGATNWVAEGDLGHSYTPNSGYLTIGPIIANFGSVTLSDSSGKATVTFAKPFTLGVMLRGASNDCGPGFPSATAGTGNPTLTTMNVGMSVTGPSSGAAFVAAIGGTAATWWAVGL